MALLELLFKSSPVEIDSVVLDASLSEEHTSEVELTDHPVETGADITDHKRKRPEQVRITGVISNTPLKLFNFVGGGDRAEAAWKQLKEIQAGKKLIEIVTTLQVYKNMAIVSLSVPRDAQRGNSLEVTIVAREVFTASSQTVEAPELARPPASSLGKKPTPPADAATEQSLLSKLAGLAGF